MTIDGLLGLVAAAALILANGLFVLGEFALVTVDRARVEHLAAEGDRGAARVLAALRRLSFELSAAQLGITITSILLGFVAEPVLAHLLEPVLDVLPGLEVDAGTGVTVGAALGLATVVQMVVGELVPKSLAIVRPLRMAKLAVRPFGWFTAAFRPLIAVLNGAANLVVGLLRIQPREELLAARSLEELGLLIRASVEHGTLDPKALPLLARVISFGEKAASTALVPRGAVVALRSDESVAELVRRSAATGHSRFPVHEGDLDQVVGLVHVRDAARVPRALWDRTPVSDLAQPVTIVPESRGLASLLTDMTSQGRQLAAVVDEYGGTAGILTLEDILEELVGEIEDEYDRAVPVPVDGRGTPVVSGMLHADELREVVGFELPEGEYETLAGFLLDRWGRIPSVGDRLDHEGWQFEVVGMDGRRIDRVRITPPPRGREGGR